MNMMIGGITPPYGMSCFITSGISGEPLTKVFKEIFPMTIALIIVLLLITYIPVLVTGISSLMS